MAENAGKSDPMAEVREAANHAHECCLVDQERVFEQTCEAPDGLCTAVCEGQHVAIDAIVSAAERAVEAARREEREKKADDLIGLCPHGFLKCFYCWRDAGFPGGAQP